MEYLCLSFFLLAAICNAIMDTVDHHFSISIFDRIKDKSKRLWWNEDEGWRNKYIDRDKTKGRVKWKILGVEIIKPVQITDSWHFFKMLMIIFVAISVVCYRPSHLDIFDHWWINFLISRVFELTVLGFIWNTTFSFFYEYVLLKPIHRKL